MDRNYFQEMVKKLKKQTCFYISKTLLFNNVFKIVRTIVEKLLVDKAKLENLKF